MKTLENTKKSSGSKDQEQDSSQEPNLSNKKFKTKFFNHKRKLISLIAIILWPVYKFILTSI